MWLSDQSWDVTPGLCLHVLSLSPAPNPGALPVLLHQQRPHHIRPWNRLFPACGSSTGHAAALRKPCTCPCLSEGQTFTPGWAAEGHSCLDPRMCQLSRAQVPFWEGGRIFAGSRGHRGGSGALKVALALAVLLLPGSPSIRILLFKRNHFIEVILAGNFV